VQRAGDCPPHSLRHHPGPKGSTSVSPNRSSLLNDAILSSCLSQSETGRYRAVRERSSPGPRQRPRREDMVFPYLVSSIRITLRRSTTPPRHIRLHFQVLTRGKFPRTFRTAPAVPRSQHTIPACTRCPLQVGAPHHQAAHR